MYRRSIHWHRRDLRVGDNAGLHEAVSSSAEVVPVYVLSDWKGRSHLWTGPARQQFLCGCLSSLARNIAQLGGNLILRQGDAEEEIARLVAETGAEALFYNRDPDPHGIAMEHRLSARCSDLGVAIHPCTDVAMHEREGILKGDGSPYRVYTPYSRRWLDLSKASPLPKPKRISTPEGIRSIPLPDLSAWGLSPGAAVGPTPGERAARDRLKEAVTHRLTSYGELRDLPARDGTSRLSQDLRLGTLSIRTVYHEAERAMKSARSASKRENLLKFIKELAWRDFYMQILFHFPEVLELEFNPDYRGLPWAEAGTQFEAWKSGETGFPIVDAGMRELAGTGFMHNRVRMIVAMFLTKDLHLDWRLGEQFFMQSLVDGEIASNNGGWQWSAGTGADAAPYFRIQNPWTQTKRYDAQGEYIRKWVPELADADAKRLHTPPPNGEAVAPGYPAPIVNHKEERERCLSIFKRHLARKPR